MIHYGESWTVGLLDGHPVFFTLQIVEMSGMPQRGDHVTAMFSATLPKEIQVRIRYRRLSCEVVTRFVDIEI